MMTGRDLFSMEPTENFLSQSFTFSMPKDAGKAKDLSYEDPKGDEELGYYPNSTSEISGGHFSQEHGNHVGGQTCRQRTRSVLQLPDISTFTICSKMLFFPLMREIKVIPGRPQDICKLHT